MIVVFFRIKINRPVNSVSWFRSELLSDQERQAVCSQANAATQLLRWHSEELKRVVETDQLTERSSFVLCKKKPAFDEQRPV